MKKIIVIIGLVFISFTCIGQTKLDTCFTQEELVVLANKIQKLQHNDSINNIIILEQIYQLEQYKRLHKNDSLMVLDYQYLMGLMGEQIDIYKMFQKDIKPKWYDSKFLWFAGGVATIVLSSWVVSNVN